MIQLFNRPNYIERISPFINKNIIKVLTGQRRVGKSCILRQIQAHIEATHINQRKPSLCFLFKKIQSEGLKCLYV